jgi:hypothetical protein
MPTKTLGLTLIIVGILLLTVSLLADVIGIGARPAVIGWKQIAGAVVGLAVCVVGIVTILRARTSEGG